LICGAFSALMKSTPDLTMLVACAWVIIARSPTNTTRSIPKRSRTLLIASGTVV
jgi:hypothetical protein